jgi:DNA-binding MurR/RpiR family transcriptional regulator
VPSPQQARAQASAITAGGTAPAQDASPTSRLRELFEGPGLSPAHRRIAQYLIEHLTEAAFLSITDLAERVGVSQPSVTRFAGAVGFSGYPALRERLQSLALGSLGNGVPSAPAEQRGNELQAAVDAEIENLENLRRDLTDPGRVIEVGRKLSRSTPLTILGLRISASLAEYFAYAARRIHPDVRLVTRGGSVAYDALLQSREAGGTWVLAFSMPRHAQETLTAVQVARGAGLKIALVTDLALGALAGGPAAEVNRSNELQAAVDAEIENLENLRRDFADPDQVIDVGRKLSQSTPLTIVGLRISASLAEYFAYAARRVHPDVRLVTRGGSVAYDALLQSREAGGTWALAFSMPRHAQETLTAVRVARSAGLKVALITDLALGPVADEADATFATGTGSRLVFDSYAAPGVMAAALLQAMTDADPERTQGRLEDYEQISEQHQFFLRD